jgi:hypothetical protein
MRPSFADQKPLFSSAATAVPLARPVKFDGEPVSNWNMVEHRPQLSQLQELIMDITEHTNVA